MHGAPSKVPVMTRKAFISMKAKKPDCFLNLYLEDLTEGQTH